LFAAVSCKPVETDSGLLALPNDKVFAFEVTAAKALQAQYADDIKQARIADPSLASDEAGASAGIRAAFDGRFPTVSTYIDEDIMVSVASNDQEVAYIIRGTEISANFDTTTKNIFRDIFAWAEEVGEEEFATGDRKLKVPKGFLTAATKAFVLLANKKEIEPHAKKQIYFIGHSLGGAASQILAFLFDSKNMIERSADRKPYVFSYGSPVAGNERFFKRLFAVATVRKFIHPDDLVTRVPFDHSLKSLFGENDYYETNDINVVTGTRRVRGEKHASFWNPQSHLGYAEHMAKLASSGKLTDPAGGSVYGKTGGDASTNQALDNAKVVADLAKQPATNAAQCVMKHYELSRLAGAQRGTALKNKGGLNDVSGDCWKTCQEPSQSAGIIPRGDFLQWNLECRDHLPLTRAQLVADCRACVRGCIDIAGYDWDKSGNAVSEKMQRCDDQAAQLKP